MYSIACLTHTLHPAPRGRYGDDVAAAYEVQGIPALFIVGLDGTFIHTDNDTSDDFEALAAMIDQQLKEHGK